jgi:hypothetical protein
VLVLSVAVAALAGIGLATVAHSRAQRADPQAFRSYLETYLAPADQAWLAGHWQVAQEEADRSCAWLDRQPIPPANVDPSGHFAFDTVINQYLHTPTAITFGPSGQGRSFIVAGAWAYLCHGSRDAHTAPRSLEED